MNPPDDNLTLAIALAAVLLLLLERITYAVAWNRPDGFARLARRAGFPDPVSGLEAAFVAFKLLQGAVFTGWCAWFGALSGWPDGFGTVAAFAGAALICAGQVLNLAVFFRLGRVGVFYGNRFGHAVPWCEGFPFSLLSHPQYVGTVLTIWGIFLVARYPHDDWLVLPLVETLYYAIGAQLERGAQLAAGAAG